jgi:hypothetical protein
MTAELTPTGESNREARPASVHKGEPMLSNARALTSIWLSLCRVEPSVLHLRSSPASGERQLVTLSGEEIRKALQVFAAQTFCNELRTCFGHDSQAVATFERAQAGRFLDLAWLRICIIEMKAPKEAKRLGNDPQPV